MKKNPISLLLILSFLVWIFPTTVEAHHMSQGIGSAPDMVDDYAHGVNSGGDNEAGSDEAGNMGDGAGNAELGADSSGPGEPTEDGDNGAPDDVPGTATEPGGPASD